jgi:hypothetical protein
MSNSRTASPAANDRSSSVRRTQPPSSSNRSSTDKPNDVAVVVESVKKRQHASEESASTTVTLATAGEAKGPAPQPPTQLRESSNPAVTRQPQRYLKSKGNELSLLYF